MSFYFLGRTPQTGKHPYLKSLTDGVFTFEANILPVPKDGSIPKDVTSAADAKRYI